MAKNRSSVELPTTADGYKKHNKMALGQLLEFFNNNKAQAAAGIGVHVNTIYKWVEKGRVGWHGAQLINDIKEIPFTREHLRADVKVW